MEQKISILDSDVHALRDDIIIEKVKVIRDQGGIILPEIVKDQGRGFYGKVISIGPQQLNVEVGETVLYSDFEGIPVGKYLRIQNKHILAVITDDEVTV